MYIIETLQWNGTWWGFRYGKITGEPARFETISAAKGAYYIWNGGKRQAGKWRVVAVN